MGIGDQLIATGLAKGAAARGKKIAFGSYLQLRWDGKSEQIFRGNPNIAQPGEEHGRGIEWVAYYKGNRQYNTDGRTHWIWNYKWKCIPGEIYLTDEEKRQADRYGRGFIVVEPNVEVWKGPAVNKDWGITKYSSVVGDLLYHGYQVVQFDYPKGGPILRGVTKIRTESFREAMAILRNAALYLGPEGGLHHGAAAVCIPAVVLFGGWIPPSVTGYDAHINLTGSDKFCGSFSRCQHCVDAMSRISAAQVYAAVRKCLHEERTTAVPAQDPARSA